MILRDLRRELMFLGREFGFDDDDEMEEREEAARHVKAKVCALRAWLCRHDMDCDAPKPCLPREHERA